jgi:hypothetical protein
VSFFKPYSTLIVGMVLGAVVLPTVLKFVKR